MAAVAYQRGELDAAPSRSSSAFLTSVLKGVEAQTYEVVADHTRGEFRTREWKWGLESGASGLSYSGGYLDDLRPLSIGAPDRIRARMP
jgi:hypothetical protein